jgi:hypothetical protein
VPLLEDFLEMDGYLGDPKTLKTVVLPATRAAGWSRRDVVLALRTHKSKKTTRLGQKESTVEHAGKPRDEHRSQPVPHLGQDHYEKSEHERAVAPDAAAQVSEHARLVVETGDNVSPVPEPLGNIYTRAEP